MHDEKYTPAQEYALIEALEAWFLNEPTLKPIFKLLKHEMASPQTEFYLFIDSEEPEGYGVETHALDWDSHGIKFSDDLEEIDCTFEEALAINKQNLLARLMAMLHYKMARDLNLQYCIR